MAKHLGKKKEGKPKLWLEHKCSHVLRHCRAREGEEFKRGVAFG